MWPNKQCRLTQFSSRHPSEQITPWIYWLGRENRKEAVRRRGRSVKCFGRLDEWAGLTEYPVADPGFADGGGAQTPNLGVLTYFFANFLLKAP